MYADPRHIKKHTYKVSLNDDDRRLIELLAEKAGKQPSAFIRELAMEQIAEIATSNDSQMNAA